MSLQDAVVEVGHIVTLERAVYNSGRLGAYGSSDLRSGEEFRVTRVNRNTLQVRSDSRGYSYSIDRSAFVMLDPNAPKPRRLGQMPEEGDHIDVDDPRIQWLFEDMGKYATEQSYCTQYDALCARLGIPGRPRDFKVKTTVKGMDFTTTVQARSQREANEKVKEALGDGSVIVPDLAPAA